MRRMSPLQPRTTTRVSLDREIRGVQTETAGGQESRTLNSVASLHTETQPALVPHSASWARHAGVRRQFIRVSERHTLTGFLVNGRSRRRCAIGPSEPIGRMQTRNPAFG